MKNPNIANVLKAYRKQNHYKVEEVVMELKVNNQIFSKKTVYGWESGQTQPSADTLLVLCKIYKIDNILQTFGYDYEEEHIDLNEEERRLVLQYRKNPSMHNAVKKLLDME